VPAEAIDRKEREDKKQGGEKDGVESWNTGPNGDVGCPKKEFRRIRHWGKVQGNNDKWERLDGKSSATRHNFIRAFKKKKTCGGSTVKDAPDGGKNGLEKGKPE